MSLVIDISNRSIDTTVYSSSDVASIFDSINQFLILNIITNYFNYLKSLTKQQEI